MGSRMVSKRRASVSCRDPWPCLSEVARCWDGGQGDDDDFGVCDQSLTARLARMVLGYAPKLEEATWWATIGHGYKYLTMSLTWKAEQDSVQVQQPPRQKHRMRRRPIRMLTRY